MLKKNAAKYYVPLNEPAWKENQALTYKFYDTLLNRILAMSRLNIANNEKLLSCFKFDYAALKYLGCLKSSRSKCSKFEYPHVNSLACIRLRNEISPKLYPVKFEKNTAPEESLFGKIQQARFHLALVNKIRMQDFFKVNRSLKTEGYKSVPWSQLDTYELPIAKEKMENYRSSFMDSRSLNNDDMNKILNPFYVHRPKLLPSAKKGSSEEKNMAFFKMQALSQISRFQEDHMNQYNAIVSNYPIINYISSKRPSHLELSTAALRLNHNAKKELTDLVNVSKDMVRYYNAHQVISSSARKLLDYRLIVEDLLKANPEFCGIASYEQELKERMEVVGNALIMGPLLVATMVSPVVVSIILGGAVTTGYTFSSYVEFQEKIESAYSTHKRGIVGKASQSDVDNSYRSLQTELMMIPLGGAVGGALSSGPKVLIKRNKTSD